jgi:hypothetical protein
VDQYLQLAQRTPAPVAKAAPAPVATSGAAAYNARKELSAVERKLAKLAEQIAAVHTTMAGHDQSDYAGLGALTARLRALEAENDELEERWLELSEASE